MEAAGILRFMDSPVQSRYSKPASLTCPRAWYSGNMLQLFKLTWTTSIGVDIPTQYSSCKVTPASSARACVSSPASLQGCQASSCNMRHVKVLGNLCLSLAPQQSMNVVLRKATFSRYELQLWAWSPLKCFQSAVTGLRFHTVHFTLNFRLWGQAKKKMAQGSLEAQETCPKAEGYESTEQTDPEQEEKVFLSLSCWLSGDDSQLSWEMSRFSPFKMHFFGNVANLHFSPIWNKTLKDVFFASCAFCTLASSINCNKWCVALQYMQVATICFLNGNHPGVSLLFQVHKQCVLTDL